jgi:RNA polymerase sigma factor (sigma-70 family)
LIQAILSEVNPTTPFREALEAARRGDAVALDLLAARFLPTVQRIVHRRLEVDSRSTRPWLASRFSTNDVVQDVFFRVLRDLNAFEGDNEGAFVGYLAMVVRNRIVDMIRFHEAERRDGRRSVPDEDQPEAEGSHGDPALEAVAFEQRERLQRALDAFEPREQLLLRARLENLATFTELAEQLGYQTESGARRAYYAAHARLVLVLERH